MASSLLPGVPIVPGFLPQGVQFLSADAVSAFDGSTPQWGIYRGADPVIVCDTVHSFEVRKDHDISDFPIEQGSFASYNKVEIPNTVRIQFVIGGSDDDRRAMISSIKAIVGTTELFSAVTPEDSYANMNVVHYDYPRTATKGLGLLKIDVWLEQIRIAGTPQTSSTTQNAPGDTTEPSGASPVSDGTVQPLTPQLIQQNAAKFQIPGFIPDPDPNDSGFEGIRPLTIHPKSN